MAGVELEDAPRELRELETGPVPLQQKGTEPSERATNGRHAVAADEERRRSGGLAAIAEEPEDGEGDGDLVGPEMPKAKRRKVRSQTVYVQRSIIASIKAGSLFADGVDSLLKLNVIAKL